MKEIWENINFLLDTTNLLCQEIADELGIPVSFVNEVVEQRWENLTGVK
jgi:hypothetical protein